MASGDEHEKHSNSSASSVRSDSSESSDEGRHDGHSGSSGVMVSSTRTRTSSAAASADDSVDGADDFETLVVRVESALSPSLSAFFHVDSETTYEQLCSDVESRFGATISGDVFVVGSPGEPLRTLAESAHERGTSIAGIVSAALTGEPARRIVYCDRARVQLLAVPIDAALVIEVCFYQFFEKKYYMN